MIDTSNSNNNDNVKVTTNGIEKPIVSVQETTTGNNAAAKNYDASSPLAGGVQENRLAQANKITFMWFEC